MTDSITHVGSNAGNGYTKITHTDNTGEINHLKVKSNVSQEASQVETMTGGKYSLDVIEMEINGVPFIAGNGIEGFPTESTQYSLGHGKLAMIYASMAKAGISGQVNLVATMPFNFYFDSMGKPRRDLIKKHNELLTTSVSFTNSNIPKISIATTTTLPEGWAVFYNLLLSDKKFRSQSTLIYDIGSGTVERIICRPNGQVDMKYSLSKERDYGVHSIFDPVRYDLMQLVQEKYGRMPTITDNALSNAIQTKVIHIYGTDIDCANIVDNHLALLTGRLRAVMTSQMGDADDFDAIVFAGGGARLLEPFLQDPYWYSNDKRFLFLDEYANANSCLAVAERQASE